MNRRRAGCLFSEVVLMKWCTGDALVFFYAVVVVAFEVTVVRDAYM